MVPKAGLEPARVAPLPPQDSVSTKFHHFGTIHVYSVLVGSSTGVSADGAAASGAGSDAGSVCSTGAGASMTIDFPVLSPDIYASISDVSINKMAAAVVALLKKEDAPVLPKSVWLDPPPKAAPISAPFPVCRSTIMISAMHTTMCITTINNDIFLVLRSLIEG